MSDHVKGCETELAVVCCRWHQHKPKLKWWSQHWSLWVWYTDQAPETGSHIYSHRASVRKAPWATRDRLMGRVGGACYYLLLENICSFGTCHRRPSWVPNSQYLDGTVEMRWKGHCDFWRKSMLGTAGVVLRESLFYIQGRTEAIL